VLSFLPWHKELFGSLNFVFKIFCPYIVGQELAKCSYGFLAFGATLMTMVFFAKTSLNLKGFFIKNNNFLYEIVSTSKLFDLKMSSSLIKLTY
jgi:hypothetical protein